MHKLDFLGVTDTEYQLLATFRSAILATPRNEHNFRNSKHEHPTAYHLCDGYSTYAIQQAAGYNLNDVNWGTSRYELEKVRALDKKAIETGSYTLHKMRTRHSEFYPKPEDKYDRYPRKDSIKVEPLNLSQVLSHPQDDISVNPSPYSSGVIELSSDNNNTVDTTYQTIHGAISQNKGANLELGDLGYTCYACGEPMMFGIKEQYPLLTKEQQESVVGRAWGLLEAFYKDIRSRRGDFTEIPTVDEVLMLVNGYGVFPEPEQVKGKGKGNKRKLTATPKQHREVEANLQTSEAVDKDTRNHKEGKSKRERRHAIETVVWIIVILVWCTPLNHLVPGLESISPGIKLMDTLALMLLGYRILKF